MSPHPNPRLTQRETEAKIALRPGEPSSIQAGLIELGARRGTVDEEWNLVFRIKGTRRGDRRRSVRLRTFDSRAGALLTYKGPAAKDSIYKS